MGTSLRVAHLSYYRDKGGAAKAGQRLHHALLTREIASTFYYIDGKYERTPESVRLAFKASIKLIDMLNRLLMRLYPRRIGGAFSPLIFGRAGVLPKPIPGEKAILHLHWLGISTISVFSLLSIRPRRMVITLHDMLFLTGGCHVPGECQRFHLGCGRCPQLGSSSLWDLTFVVKQVKTWVLRRQKKCIFVAPSEFVASQFRKTKLWTGDNLRTIPNPLQVPETFVDKRDSDRVELHLKPGRPIVTFGAVNGLTDMNKGYRTFVQALGHLGDLDFSVLLFGDKYPESDFGNREVIQLGYVGDEEQMRRIYSASDLFVFPSNYETFGQVASEAMRSGCPVVCFDNSGVASVVVHRVTGYVARYKDTHDLAKGILWGLDARMNSSIAIKCHRHVHSNYSADTVADAYRKVYLELLG